MHVPQWWRRDVPLCVPDTPADVVTADEEPVASIDEVPGVLLSPTEHTPGVGGNAELHNTDEVCGTELTQW